MSIVLLLLGEVAEKDNENFRKLITLHTRIMLLSDVFTTSGFQGRASGTLLNALIGPESKGILLELGSLHRACIWDGVRIKAHPVYGPIDPIPASNGWSTSFESMIMPALPFTPIPGAGQTEPTSATSATNGVQGQTAALGGSGAPSTPVAKKDGSMHQNVRALKHYVLYVPHVLSNFFQGLFHSQYRFS